MGIIHPASAILPNYNLQRSRNILTYQESVCLVFKDLILDLEFFNVFLIYRSPFDVVSFHQALA